MKKFKIIIRYSVGIVFSFVWGYPIYADVVDCPGSPGTCFSITSDFGPRLLPTPDFHKSIDYQRVEGQTIPLLEDGTIKSLGYVSNILMVRITGDHKFR